MHLKIFIVTGKNVVVVHFEDTSNSNKGQRESMIEVDSFKNDSLKFVHLIEIIKLNHSFIDRIFILNTQSTGIPTVYLAHNQQLF